MLSSPLRSAVGAIKKGYVSGIPIIYIFIYSVFYSNNSINIRIKSEGTYYEVKLGHAVRATDT